MTPASTSFSATWSDVDGAALYQFRYRLDDERWQWDTPTEARERTVTGLLSARSYTVEVRALVGGTWRGWTRATVITGAAAEPPGGGGGGGGGDVEPPSTSTEPQLEVEISGTEAVVTWAALANADLYQFRWQRDGLRGWNWESPDTATRYVVTGLRSGRPYHFEARALIGGVWEGWASVTVPVP